THREELPMPARSPATGKWWHVTALVPDGHAHEVAQMLMDSRAYDVALRPVVNTGPAVEAPPNKGYRAAGTGKKGAARALVDQWVRDGVTEIKTVDLRAHGHTDHRALANMFVDLKEKRLIRRTGKGTYQPTAAYAKHLTKANGAAAE